jgi:hypothetical protein
LLAGFAKAAGASELLNVHDLKSAYEQAIGYETSNSTVYDLLDRHGWRKVMPRLYHPRRNVEAQNAFKKTAFLALLRYVMNRIDLDLFMACFTSWVEECWPNELDLVAIDGKTSRRIHNRKTGQKALNPVSAFATNSRLVLGQEAVFEKSSEITAIPALVERLDLKGALVSIDAMGCNPTLAQSILDAEALSALRQG